MIERVTRHKHTLTKDGQVEQKHTMHQQCIPCNISTLGTQIQSHKAKIQTHVQHSQLESPQASKALDRLPLCTTSTDFCHVPLLTGSFYTLLRTFVLPQVPQTTLRRHSRIKSLTRSPAGFTLAKSWSNRIQIMHKLHRIVSQA